MLKKTKLLLQEDTEDMWINWIKFQRSKDSALAMFKRFYLNGKWNIYFHNGVFCFVLDWTVDDGFSVEDLADIFYDEINNLRDKKFDVCFDKNDTIRRFYISMDNFTEVILNKKDEV